VKVWTIPRWRRTIVGFVALGEVFAEWLRQARPEGTVITDRAGNSLRGFGLAPV